MEHTALKQFSKILQNDYRKFCQYHAALFVVEKKSLFYSRQVTFEASYFQPFSRLTSI